MVVVGVVVVCGVAIGVVNRASVSVSAENNCRQLCLVVWLVVSRGLGFESGHVGAVQVPALRSRSLGVSPGLEGGEGKGALYTPRNPECLLFF